MFGFDFMNSVFPVIFTVMFVGIFIMFIVTAVRGIGRWHKNNNSPRLTVDATIVSKRMDVTHHHNSTTHTNSSSTWYYATFQVTSGDRMELSIPTQDYGYLVEGDHGKLTFQGTPMQGSLGLRRSKASPGRGALMLIYCLLRIIYCFSIKNN